MVGLKKTTTPLDALGDEIIDSDLYVCLTGFATGPGHRIVIREADVLLGAHEAVQNCPMFFCKAALPTNVIIGAAQKLLFGRPIDTYEQPPGPVVGSPSVRGPGLVLP